MPLLIILFGVIVLLILMLKMRMNGFISLILVALLVGVLEGLPIMDVLSSIQKGVGGTLGSLALIMGFGAMLGKLLGDSGGAQQIAITLINKFGKKNIQWAVTIAGFIVGFALFYEVGFVLLLPLVLTIAVTLNVPILYVGIPMAAALSVTHGFLPPHPGPTAIASIFKADLGKTLLYGTLIAIPTVVIAGPLFARLPFVTAIKKSLPEDALTSHNIDKENMPSFGISVFTAISPVILMALRAIAEMTLDKNNAVLPYFEFFGNPIIATLISVIIAIFTFGIFCGRNIDQINESLVSSIKLIAMMLLIIAGGGAFKQVLVDSGVKNYIEVLMATISVSPILMAWMVAAILRLALGSSTVAALTAGGISFPLIATTGASPELMVLATGAGSIIFSHVNDPGFWLFKEFFNLSIPETIKTWSILETVISVCGLIGCLLLELVI